MGITRRELFKGALTAAALALVPSLPRLPKMGRSAPKYCADFERTLMPNESTWSYKAGRDLVEGYAAGFGSVECKMDERPIFNIKQWEKTRFADLDREPDAEIMAALDRIACKHPFVVTLKRGSCWNDKRLSDAD